MVSLYSLTGCLLVAFISLKVVYSSPSEGQEIANKLGEDLSFASKQVIRGFTAVFGPLLDIPRGFPKFANSNGEANHLFQKVLLRDGINSVGKGVKASATILTVPARVVGTGLEEFKKVGQAGVESRTSVDKHEKLGSGNSQYTVQDHTKIASTLLNTTASEFSQANLGAVLVEVALKNRIRDIGNKTATYVESKRVPQIKARDTGEQKEPTTENKEDQITTTSKVDVLIERFNEAVRQNDERVLNALKSVLEKINPPKDE